MNIAEIAMVMDPIGNKGRHNSDLELRKIQVTKNVGT